MTRGVETDAAAWHTCHMREPATLKLDAGEEVRVEVDRADLERSDFVVRRSGAAVAPKPDLIEVMKAHIATAEPHPAGTTDRLLAADRDRPY